MERVQFQQEQMLSELKDLVQKGVFTQAELKQIMKKRTAFETALVRRVPRKGDFLRYAAYEMGLEALRRKRIERLKIPKGPPSVSDYALVRRQFQIFERALKKFKDDVGLWVQYLQVAKREGARALVGRISARALQIHPTSPSLYILAASHELSHLSHSAARVLLQRGIRLNPESIDLWREYLKMELGYVESLRRRWEVLGIDTKSTTETSELQNEAETADTVMSEVDDDEKARKEILDGALAKAVIDNAVKAKPTSDLFSALHSILTLYPCPQTLRKRLLEHLGNHLRVSLSLDSEPLAAKLSATWFLTPDLNGSELVDSIKVANEELSQRVKHSQDISKSSNRMRTMKYEMAEVYSAFVREWFAKDIDENIKLYLLNTLQNLCVICKSEPLLLAHLHLLSSPQNPGSISKQKLLKLAKKYTLKIPSSHSLWLFRLDLEWAEGDEGWSSSAKEARQQVPSNAEDDSARCAVWEWVLDRNPSGTSYDVLQVNENLLREAVTVPNPQQLVDCLLIRYVRSIRKQWELSVSRGSYEKGSQLRNLKRLSKLYLWSPKVWKAAFDIYSITSASRTLPPPPPPQTDSTIESCVEHGTDVDTDDETAEILKTFFDKWRLASSSAHSDAALEWGGWLLRHGKGSEAADVIATARVAMGSVGPSELELFERRWRDILDNSGGQDEGDDEGRAATT